MSGSAYIFVRSGTTWIQQAKLTASDAAALDQFGFVVAVSGDTAVVSAVYDDHLGEEVDMSGSVYVFGRSGTTWTQQAKLTPRTRCYASSRHPRQSSPATADRRCRAK